MKKFVKLVTVVAIGMCLFTGCEYEPVTVVLTGAKCVEKTEAKTWREENYATFEINENKIRLTSGNDLYEAVVKGSSYKIEYNSNYMGLTHVSIQE